MTCILNSLKGSSLDFLIQSIISFLITESQQIHDNDCKESDQNQYQSTTMCGNNNFNKTKPPNNSTDFAQDHKKPAPNMVNPNNCNQICDNKTKSEFSIDVHNFIHASKKELKNNTGIIDEMERKDPYSELEMYLEKIKVCNNYKRKRRNIYFCIF